MAQLIDHFRRIQPMNAQAVDDALRIHPNGVVLEGSAIMPDIDAPWMDLANVTYLIGDPRLIWRRMRAGSRYDSQPQIVQDRIRLFKERSLLYQQALTTSLTLNYSRQLLIDSDVPVSSLVDTVLARCGHAAMRQA